MDHLVDRPKNRWVFPLIALIVLLALASAAVYAKRHTGNQAVAEASPSPTDLTITPSPTDRPPTDWLTYANAEYGIRLQYPPSLTNMQPSTLKAGEASATVPTQLVDFSGSPANHHVILAFSRLSDYAGTPLAGAAQALAKVHETGSIDGLSPTLLPPNSLGLQAVAQPRYFQSYNASFKGVSFYAQIAQSSKGGDSLPLNAAVIVVTDGTTVFQEVVTANDGATPDQQQAIPDCMTVDGKAQTCTVAQGLQKDYDSVYKIMAASILPAT